MRVIFSSVTVKNFMSYGNVETTIELNQHKNTIITGKNGAGKSSIVLDGLCYALFNKPYRKINLPQLVNSINKKDLRVTCPFTIGTDQYKVIRGIKPAIFEIWKNGELIPEDSSTRDYQSILENDILGFNYKLFKQVVVIGSASYVQFMNLTAAERRAITEDVLDISVFSGMLDIAKKKVSEYKSTIETLTYETGLLKTQIESQKTLLTTLEQETSTKQAEFEKLKLQCQENIQRLEDEKAQIDARLDELSEASGKHQTITANREKLEKQIWKLESKADDAETKLHFYDKDSCPTCSQKISDAFRTEKQQEITGTIDETRKQLDAGGTLLEQFNTRITELSAMVKEYNTLNQRRREAEQEIVSENKMIARSTSSVSTESLDLCKAKLKELVGTLVEKTEAKNTAGKEIEYYKASVEILKDSGIKAKVISTFIPIMNQMINEYLEKFEMFVSFELDEMFNETIKSRNRDIFTYNSFSEGEKQKIDLSILFAWRKIAMTRNSASTNIIIFDETLDKSLDEESVDAFVDILDSVEEGVNSIVVSHRSVIPEIFDRHIRVSTQRDFSIVEYN